MTSSKWIHKASPSKISSTFIRIVLYLDYSNIVDSTKIYKKKKGNLEESGIVHSSIHSSKIVHYYLLISSSTSSSFFNSRRTFDVDLVKEQRRDKCTLLGSLIENDHDGRSLRTKILLFPTRVSPFQRLSVFLKYLPSIGLLDIFVGRLRKASSLCNVACDTL